MTKIGHKLLLFDIDGTLIGSGGAGTRSLNLAFEELFAIPDGFAGISMAGKTDIQILREGCALHGIRTDNGVLPSILSSYVRHLRREILRGGLHAKPGVANILEALSDRADCHVGLLTGNIEEGAMIKLDAAGLLRYFRGGAFGSDHEDRNFLLPIAVRKFEALLGERLPYGRCVVIGDTPRDVACAKPYGALSVAVATGPFTHAELLMTGADLVLNDLAQTEMFINYLLGTSLV